jgi:YggT family protein
VDFFLRVLYLSLVVYAWLIVARALFSWFPLRPGTILYRVYTVVYDVTEPYLAVFRRFLPTPRVGSVGIDLSSIVGLLVILVAMQLVGSISS